MSSRTEKAAHIAEVSAVLVALVAVIMSGCQTRESLELTREGNTTAKGALEQTREANITYQGTPICQAYREFVIELHLHGYTNGEIRSTFLGEHDDVMQPPSEDNNVYEGFYLDQCGSIDGITRRLSRPPPSERSRG